ncbi:MAG TPA: ABC transporter permease [Anaerolineales bacterium]|nr:ABC transporter permease [Anaerolineales bacterium]
MNYMQSFIEASESLLANKMRSGLTVLGIIIGVAAVIAVLAIGNGTQESILGEIQGVGTNLLFVTRGGSEDVSNPKPLTLSDADALADPFSAPSIEGVAPALNGRVEMKFAGENKSTSLVGVTPDYETVRNVVLSEGEFITSTDLSGRSAVVIIGTEVADALFGRKSGLVGEKIRIEGQPFRVIGVLEEKGGSAMGSEDDQILVPMTTAQTRLLQRSTPNQVDVIYVQAVDSDAVPQASLEISQILSSRHRTMIGEEDFSILSQQDFLDLASTITGVLTIFLGGIAAISLLVGGIGIMNIMMVSVVERTREIGLRKALGARRIDILSQFLIESSLLSLVGGFIGILLGWTLSMIVEQIAAGSGTPIVPIISLNAVLLAVLFSAAIGIFFGLYPANRASQLEPVEALRYE